VSGRRIVLVAAALVVAGIVLGLVMLRRRPATPAETRAAAPVSAEAGSGRKIKAQLFYVGEEGRALTGVERDVPFAEGTAAQARAIIGAQLAPPEEPLVSAIPPGTTLRALFVTQQGDAYVDLSKEAAAAHPGGSTHERLTIYTIVDALIVNLPAIRAVQILVDGREVESLAGHVSLRGPLHRERPASP
jgi:spore germination protein GerM